MLAMTTYPQDYTFDNISEDDFVALSRAYFAEIETRFAETP